MRKWLVRFLLLYVLWRWLGPEPRPRFSPPQQHPLRLAGQSVFVGERELFVRQAGPEDAPPVLLIHGWATDSLFNWYKLIPLLSDRYRVIAVDQRNSGKSDYVRARYEIAEVADEIASLVARLELGVVPVVGYSMGGMIAQELAHRHPYLVGKVVLAATAATVTPQPQDRLRVTLLMWLGRAWDRLSKAEFSWVRQRYLRMVGAVEEGHARWLWESYMSRDVNMYYEGGFAVARFDSRAWVGRLAVDALVIVPTDDQLIPSRLQHELASQLERSTVVEVEGGRHESVLTHAGEYAKAIRDFLG